MVDSPIPTTSATRAPGMRLAMRLRTTIPMIVPMPRAVVYRLSSSRLSPMATTFCRIVPPTAGIPSRAGIWPMVMTTARPMTNPVTTDAARNCDRNPSLAAPATIRMPPTMSASPALSAT